MQKSKELAMVNRYELHTDVLVLGSGPSGFAAAYTAARNGANVILCEQNGDVGGISTSGLMSHWTGSCGSPLFNEILKRSAENNESRFKNKITDYPFTSYAGILSKNAYF